MVKKLTQKERLALKEQEEAKQIEFVETTEYSVDEYNKAVEEIKVLEEMSEGQELPWKLERFCQEYVTHYDEDRAAQKAGFPPWHSIAVGKRLIADPIIQSRIQQLQEFESVKLGINRSRILSEYMKFVNFNVQDVIDDDGCLKPLHELDRSTAAAIRELKLGSKKVKDKDGNEVLKSYIKEFATVDKKSALDALAKHLGLFDKDQKKELPIDLKTLLTLLDPEKADQIKLALAKRIGEK